MRHFEQDLTLGKPVGDEPSRRISDLRRSLFADHGDDRVSNGPPASLLEDLAAHLTSRRNRRDRLLFGGRIRRPNESIIGKALSFSLDRQLSSFGIAVSAH